MSGLQIPGVARFPFIDVATGERWTIEDQVARFKAFDVHHRNNSAHHHGELHQPEFFELRSLERRVGSAESNGLRFDLFDAATGSDGLIIETDAGVFSVDVRPFGIDRVGKGCAGTGYIARKRRARHAAGQGYCAQGHRQLT